MTEIKLTKRYPHSRTEDITDAFMRGYEQGKKDGLKVGKQIVLGAFETYITADRKTENSSEKPNNSTISKMEQVEEPQMGDAKPIPLSNRVTHIKDEPKTQMKTQNSNLTFEKADEFKQFDREALILLIECQRERIAELLAKDEPQTERSE